MTVLSKTSSDLHLEAVYWCEKIDKILTKLEEGEFHTSQEVEIGKTIRFFGKNVGRLQECNEDIIKLAHIFLCVKDKYIPWSLRDMNAFLLLITTMLLKRREETVIRQVSLILIEFAKSLKEKELTSLAKLHIKPIVLILHKMSKLSTLYTQTKLLKILNIVASVLDDKGAKIIIQDRLINISSFEHATKAFEHFKNIKSDDFLNSSRQFLKFYNEEIIQQPHVHSIEGFLLGVNDKTVKGIELLIDFNLRNLSVSFFGNMNFWLDSEDSDDNVTHFVELEDCEVEAVPFKFENPDHVEVTLKPSRWQILDKNDHPIEDIPSIETVKLVVSNTNDLFMCKILPKLKDKTPMFNDNNMTDQESLISFQTLATSVGGEIRFQPKINLTYDVLPTLIPENRSTKARNSQTAVKQIQETIVQGVQDHLPEKASTQSLVALSGNTATTSQEPPKKPSETQRQTAKIGPIFNNISNPFAGKARPKFTGYDEIPQDERLPPVSQFMNYQRNIRRRKILTGMERSQEPVAGDQLMNSTYTLHQTSQPKSIFTQKSPVVKRNTRGMKTFAPKLTPKKATNQTLDYSTDEDFSTDMNEALLGRPKRKGVKRVLTVSDSDEFLPAKKVRKRQSPAVKPKEIPAAKPKPTPSIKSKLAPVVKLKPTPPKPKLTRAVKSKEAQEDKTKKKADLKEGPKVVQNKEQNPIPAQKPAPKDLRQPFSFKSSFADSSNLFDKLKASEVTKVSKFLAESKEAPVPLPPRAVVKNLKREPLQDVTNQPLTKKPCLESAKLPNRVKRNNPELKRQKRVSFDDKMQFHSYNDANIVNTESLETEKIDVTKQQENETKKQNRVKPQLAQLKLPTAKPLKQQDAVQLKPSKVFAEGKENYQPQAPKPKKVQLPIPKPTQAVDPKLPKCQSNQLLNNRNDPHLQQNTKQQPATRRYQPRSDLNDDIVYNYDAVGRNTILDMFLNDAMSVEQEQVEYEDSLDENLHIRTQTMHKIKKMSPTMIRSVHIKEVNLMPKVPEPPVESKTIAMFDKKTEQSFSNALMKKSHEVFEPLLKMIETLENISVPSEAKKKLKESVNKSRESKALFRNHVQDHLKLLKRLHHSKRKLTQLFDLDQENMIELKLSLKEVVRDTRATCKEKLEEIEHVRQTVLFVEKEVKSAVWQKHLNSVNNQMQQVLQHHYEI